MLTFTNAHLRSTACLLCMLTFVMPVKLAAGPVSEYQLKGAYLLNLAKFIDWPEDSHAPEVPFLFCLVGIEQYASDINASLKGKQVHGRKTHVRHLGFKDPADDCQVLFVGEVGDTRLYHIVEESRRTEQLLIGQEPDFLSKGGDINFFAEPKRLRFEINPLSIRDKGLDVSSRLLSLARVIEVPVARRAEP